jgi:hypothetical protein
VQLTEYKLNSDRLIVWGYGKRACRDFCLTIRYMLRDFLAYRSAGIFLMKLAFCEFFLADLSPRN